VIEARDGREGVELFRRHARKISLVLLDMMMPVMGGEKRSKRSVPSVPASP
jgi:CheY-like chemotaxis protein